MRDFFRIKSINYENRSTYADIEPLSRWNSEAIPTQFSNHFNPKSLRTEANGRPKVVVMNYHNVTINTASMSTSICIPDEHNLQSFGFLYNKGLNFSHTKIICKVGWVVFAEIFNKLDCHSLFISVLINKRKYYSFLLVFAGIYILTY